MTTNVTNIEFEDGVALTIVLCDGHTFTDVGAIDFQERGIVFEATESSVTSRYFAPYEFVQTVNQSV